jgi:hypothetical protein
MTVLLVGQVRNELALMYSVRTLSRMQRAGIVNRVILATWTSEVRKIAHLVDELTAHGVSIVVSEEPSPRLSVVGHLMHQMRGVDLALESVEDTEWVLRARPDMLIDADMSLNFTSSVGTLQNKIWTPFAELCTPMCMSDITYYGQYKDIVRLQNFDYFHEVAATHVLLGDVPIISYDSEVRRYTPAFVESHQILGEYYRIYNRFYLGVRVIREAMIEIIYDHQIYWEYMSAYFDVLDRYVLIGSDVTTAPVRLTRETTFEQSKRIGCIDTTRCFYLEQTLSQNPSMTQSMHLFADGPMYATKTTDVLAMKKHLMEIGAPLLQRRAEALNYRKDASRMAALSAFKGKLKHAYQKFIAAGSERWPPPSIAWLRPFAQSYVDLA